jgi:predicted nucleic acid-binding protein
MNDKCVFIDTNIFVYAKLKSETEIEKHSDAVAFLHALTPPVVVSTQVLNELANVLLKNGIAASLVQESVHRVAQDCHVAPVALSTVEKAWAVKLRYQYSYWDSLIIAGALETNCTRLYTEDLQHDQVIFDKLVIANPFKSP